MAACVPLTRLFTQLPKASCAMQVCNSGNCCKDWPARYNCAVHSKVAAARHRSVCAWVSS
eukprot:11842193-Prorocentrum_lima.AAC.1